MDGRMSLLTSPFVPEGMVDLMKKLSKGVIKERPTNIHAFAADFFERMLIERDGSLDKGYGKFRSYTEYCKFMDKMEQRRLNQPPKKDDVIKAIKDTPDAVPDEVDPPFNIEVQGVAIQGVERKSKDSSKDSVKNVSINPKYQSQSEKVMKPVVSNVSANTKNVKAKPRKLSSKKPSENLIVIKEETSADDDDNGNSGESNLHRAAATIQKAFRVYLSNKNNENENARDASGEVSLLSENAAALIIQKAFKSLLQKIKASTSNLETTGGESNNNEVLAVAGQENYINSEKITNNNDENSEQILLEDTLDDTVTKQDFELKENQIEDALDDTATTSEVELKEDQLAKNVEDVTDSDKVAQTLLLMAQQTDGNEDQNEDLIPNVSIESHSQIPDNITESSTNDDISPKNNEGEVASDETAVELVVDSNTEKSGETVSDEVPLIEQHKSAENNVDDTVGQEIELIINQRSQSSSDYIESNENQVVNILEDTYGTDSQVESEPSHAADIPRPLDSETRADQVVTGQLEMELDNQKDNEADHIALEQGQTTTDIGTDVKPPIVEDIIEIIAESHIQHNQSHPENVSGKTEALNILDENITDGNRSEEGGPNRLIEENVLEGTTDEAELNEKSTELNVDTTENVEQTESKEQLFSVEKDGIYVNLDLLQDKLGQIAIDDGPGSDSEKSFKLNILEREEILVNQENFQQMGDDHQLVKAKDSSVDNNNESVDVAQKDSNFEEVDDMANNTALEDKEEEGNEEYELAETVVLVDYPLRRNSSGDNQNPRTTDTDDVMEIHEDIAVEKRISVTTVEPLKHESTKVAQQQQDQSNNELEPNIEPDMNVHESSKVAQQNQSNNVLEPNIEPDMNVLSDAGQNNTQAIEISGIEIFAKEVETNHENINDQEADQNNNGDLVNIDETSPEYMEKSDKDKQDEIESETNVLEDITSQASQEDQHAIQEKNEAEIINSSDIEEAREQCPDLQTNDDQLLRIEENEKLVKAATTIQKVFRGYVVRSSAQKTNNDNNDLRLSAALIIQKYARGYLVRRYLQKANNFNLIQVTSNDKNEIQEDVHIIEDTETTELVPKLPAYSNRFLIPKDSFLERESFADDEDYSSTCKELAATSIQKTYRGYRVRRALKPLSDTTEVVPSDTTDVVPIEMNGDEKIAEHPTNKMEFSAEENEVETVVTAVTEAERVISEVLCVATDVLPLTLDSALEEKTIEHSQQETQEKSSIGEVCSDEAAKEHDSVLGQIIRDNIHVEGQMQQKYNQMTFQDSSAMNPIEEMSDGRAKSMEGTVTAFESVESKFDGIKSFSYEQLSSDLSDTEENKRESLKEYEVDDTSRDERDDLSEVENFDLSSCGEDSLEAMYYSLRKNEIMIDRMQKQVTEQRDSKGDELECAVTDNLKTEFPERVTENLDAAMNQVFKSMESSSDWDVGGKDEDDNSSTLDIGLDDSSSINDEKEIETSRQIKRLEEINYEVNEQSQSTIDAIDNENNGRNSQVSSESNFAKDMELNTDQGQQSDSSLNSSTRFIMKSQSVSEDMMNPIMFAMKRKQALLDQMHVRPYPLQENLSEDHDAFPEHLLSDIDIGNIQRKIFASSVSETDSDYIEPNPTNRRLVRDDFNISTALDHLSTDSDSTIVSAATKIQAGARGFLTRRRLRRSSAGGTSISFEKRYSFGNAAIDKSLEDLIKRQEQINLDGAALKIQQQYRRYQARKKNLKKVSPIREQTLELSGGSSIEGFDEDNIGITEITFAQKKINHSSDERNNIRLNIDEVDTVQPVKTTPVNQRRLTLQRGDAVQRNSRPDSPDLNARDVKHTSTDNPGNEKFKDSETGEYTGSIISKPEKKVTPYINIQSLINRGIGPRQRSMPVQIDSELMRIIPKHLRKRVRSADIAKKKNF